jgi:hypothetical protein
MDKEKIEELLKNKKSLNKDDIKKWSKEQLIENCLFLYDNSLLSHIKFDRFLNH